MNGAENFLEQEFIPKSVYSLWGAKAMRFIDYRIPPIMQYLRNVYGVQIIINDWHVGGDFDRRCLRPYGSVANIPAFDLCNINTPPDPDFIEHSCHSFGRAVDFNVNGVSVSQVQQDILNKYCMDLLKLGVSGIEAFTDTWIHLSVSDFSLWTELKQQNGIYLIPVPAVPAVK
jgi:hypothetical protein